MSLFANAQKPCLCVCSPHRKFLTPDGRTRLDTVTVEWQRAKEAMVWPTNINRYELFADGYEIGAARSMVAKEAVSHKPQKPEFVLFIDDDVLAPKDALVKLFFRARTTPQYDIYAGVYCLKRPEVSEPLVYGENGQGPIWDWAVGDLLTTEGHGVKSVHMGLTLIRVSLLRRMLDAGVVHGDGADQDDEPFFKTEEESSVKGGVTCHNLGTEDIYFCHKASKVGCKILVDTSVLAGHIDKETGVVYGLPTDYGPVARARWLQKSGGTSADRHEADAHATEVECDECAGLCQSGAREPDRARADACPKCRGEGRARISTPLKLALDLGAGSTRRQWAGHVTYTTDLRKDSGADYVQDTLLLNLPDDHYDLTASCHHLEHLGRWDQDRAWSEIYRVTRPGGITEHLVPSLEWAAAKVAAGDLDQYVFDVLYGAQEGFGYDRQFNSHYFGYAKAVAKDLAEGAGFVNVTVEDWRDRAELLFHLVIRGEKPNVEQPRIADAAGREEGGGRRGQEVCGQGVQGAGRDGCHGG